MQIRTVVDGPLALRMRRLDAAREGATGRQILTLPLLAARLARRLYCAGVARNLLRDAQPNVLLHGSCSESVICVSSTMP
ncbi:hypothetical protein JJE66_35225 [Bradyrhizobium diazoefficiens]|uniref:hypothetical protein n=1 Tax=Bradyrhizobium diazoefficiens TaxID=1355477 RepID=UPI00190B65EE|nr:hypothetical protein [Bradyrhizobium diazoefficiens]MBK3666451.1 hypothetical protein [Bradyrhizobium diazoefficiens]